MKRTIIAFCLLALVSGCKNKKDPEPEPQTQPTQATTAPAPKGKDRDKDAPPPAPEKQELPPPSDVAAAPAGAGKSTSGLAWTILEQPTGTEMPGPDDRVEVHYSGWTKDGKMFDSSEVRGTPATFGVGQVIKGWTEGLQLMKVGEKRRFWIPADLAYGETARRPGSPSGQLTFDVKLLSIIAAPKVPKDVAAPPPTAKKTASGLAYVMLTEGTGKTPTTEDRVEVHYSGWTKDGKMFDSSVTRGQPLTFAVTGVIKGWTEGLQLMKEGGKARFWIPADLAYGDTPSRPGAPTGQLTFDVDLRKVL